MNTDALPAYIIASNKEWHRPSFELLKKECVGDWHWVSSPEALLKTTEKVGNPRYIFFLHWSHLVPERLWSQHECVCFHMTDLPYGRGGSPLQNLILRGHKDTVLTAFRMVEALDAGPVYVKRPLSLAGTAEQIYRKAGELSTDIIRSMIFEQPEPTEQTGEVVTFKRRTPEQSELPVGASAQHLYDFIRMLDADGYPHAFSRSGDYIMTYTDAELTGGESTGGELKARVVITPASGLTSESDTSLVQEREDT